jgi:hypothetical protein
MAQRKRDAPASHRTDRPGVDKPKHAVRDDRLQYQFRGTAIGQRENRSRSFRRNPSANRGERRGDAGCSPQKLWRTTQRANQQRDDVEDADIDAEGGVERSMTKIVAARMAAVTVALFSKRPGALSRCQGELIILARLLNW